VLSTYALGAFGGQMAAAAWLLPLVIVLGWTPQDLPALIPLAALSPMAGLLYVELIWWLPRRLLWRSLLFGVVTTATMGIMAAAVGGPPESWGTLLLASGIGASVPLAVRGLVWAFARPHTSVLALRVGQSISLLFLSALVLAPASGPILDVVRAAPAPAGAFALVFVGLGVAMWTVGWRPVEERPRWFRLYGVLLTAFLMAVGIGVPR
jgi:hypothetical protein